MLESCWELPAPGPWVESFFSGEKGVPPPHTHLGGCSEVSGGGGHGVSSAGSAQVREAGLGPDAGPTCGAHSAELCYLRPPDAPGFPPSSWAKPRPLTALLVRAEEGKN